MMKEISGKTPLILKLDESDIQGPLRIRVNSLLRLCPWTQKEGEPSGKAACRSLPGEIYEKRPGKKRVVLGAQHLPRLQPGLCPPLWLARELKQFLWRSAGRRQFGWENSTYIMIFVSGSGGDRGSAGSPPQRKVR